MQLTPDREMSMRSVHHAAELAGGYEPLADRLGVRSADVVEWACGMRAPDTTTLLFVLDVIMQETQRLARGIMALGLAEQALVKAKNGSKAA